MSTEFENQLAKMTEAIADVNQLAKADEYTDIDIEGVSKPSFSKQLKNKFDAFFIGIRQELEGLKNEIILVLEKVFTKNNSIKILFSITDLAGRRSWLEINDSGRPTEHSLGILRQSLNIKESFFNQSNISLGTIAFAITDSNNKRSWIEIDNNGNPTRHTVDIIYSQISNRITADYFPAKPREIVFIGDSLTAGAGGNGTTIATSFTGAVSAAGLAPVSAFNFGVGGESSSTIAARVGALPFMISAGTIINANAANYSIITFDNFLNNTAAAPLIQGDGDIDSGISPFFADLRGQIEGIDGYIVYTPNSTTGLNEYRFYRYNSGAEITLTKPAPFYNNTGKNIWNSILVLWLDQDNNDQLPYVIPNVRHIINKMTGHESEKRFIVLNKTDGDSARDVEFFSAFGNKFISPRKSLVDFGLEMAGLIPTSQDLIDIQNGIIPTSLRVDNVHLNEHGYRVIGKLIFEKCLELNYI